MIKTNRKRFLLWGGALTSLLLIVGLVLVYANLSRLVEAGLSRVLGPGLAIGQVEMHWNRISFHQVSIGSRGEGDPPRLQILQLTVTPSLRTIFAERFQIGSISVDKPRILIEIAPDGKVVNPLPPLATEEEHKKGGSGKAFAVTIGSITIRNGEVTILDRHVAKTGGQGLSNPRERYHLSLFTDVALHTGRLDLPDSGGTIPFKLTCQAPVNGTLKLEGSVAPATMNSSATLAIRQWDITRFHPYYQKPGEMTTTRGSLSADCTISIRDHLLHAPGSIRLKDMTVDAAGSRGLFFGMPTKAVLWFLENNKDEIAVNFTVSGRLDNPRFKVKQAFMDKVGSALARKMGIPLLGDMGKGLVDLGGKGVRGIKGIFGGGGR
jgi:hypothetical protein